MVANFVTKLGWTSMKIVGKNEIPAAYGPVLRKFQSAIIFAIFGRWQKSAACMIMTPCIKFG